MIHPFKAIAKEYREGRKVIIETFYESGEVPNKISSKVFLFLCSIFDLIVITPYIKFCDLLTICFSKKRYLLLFENGFSLV